MGARALRTVSAGTRLRCCRGDDAATTRRVRARGSAVPSRSRRRVSAPGRALRDVGRASGVGRGVATMLPAKEAEGPGRVALRTGGGTIGTRIARRKGSRARSEAPSTSLPSLCRWPSRTRPGRRCALFRRGEKDEDDADRENAASEAGGRFCFLFCFCFCFCSFFFFVRAAARSGRLRRGPSFGSRCFALLARLFFPMPSRCRATLGRGTTACRRGRAKGWMPFSLCLWAPPSCRCINLGRRSPVRPSVHPSIRRGFGSGLRFCTSVPLHASCTHR